MPTQLSYANGYCNSATSTATQWIYPQNWTSNATTISNQWYQSYQYRPTFGGSDTAWYQWVQDTNNVTWGSYAQAQQMETPEQAEARRAVRERRDRERTAARARARILLGEFLSDDQKAELERHGRFHVTGSKGRRYCIRTTSQAGNVDLLKPDGAVQATLCCHPRNYLPDEDAWLMQMIELRHDEEHFLRTANVQRGSLPVAA